MTIQRGCPQPSRVFPRISLPKTMFRLCISCVPCRPQRRVDSQLIVSAAAHVLESFKNKTRQRTLQCIRRGQAAAFISCCCREPAPPLCLPPCICCVSVCVCVCELLRLIVCSSDHPRRGTRLEHVHHSTFMRAFWFNCNSLPPSPACPCSSCLPPPTPPPALKQKRAKQSGGMKFYRHSQRFVALMPRCDHRLSNQMKKPVIFIILIRCCLKLLENVKSSMQQQHWFTSKRAERLLLGRAVCSWVLLKHF